MNRLRVIRVYKSVKSSGGVHIRLRELLPRLAEHVDLRVLCYRERGSRAAELEALGIPVDLIRTGVKWAPWNVSRYVSHFRRHRPDVVHTHEYTANTLGITAAARAGVPVRVRHLHTLVPWGWDGALRTRLRVAADVRAARRAHCTVAVSRAVREHYLGVTGLPPQTCRVLYNGVDLERFRVPREAGLEVRRELGIPDGAPLAGIVGRISKGKGHRQFLEAARIVAGRLPSARFLVVGEGSGLPTLKAQATELGIRDRVTFAGQRNDVPSVLAALDLFVFSSIPGDRGRIQDGLPGVVIEAQAAGIPVAGFGLPMMREVVDDGRTGVLVRVGDVDALALESVEYLRDRDRRLREGETSRRNAGRFSLETCVEQTLALYEELIRGRERAKP